MLFRSLLERSKIDPNLVEDIAWRKDSTDSDVFDEIGIDLRALEEGLEGAVEEVGCLRVFEAAFSTFRDGCAESAGYDNLSRTVSQMLITVNRSPRTSSAFFSNKLALPFLLAPPAPPGAPGLPLPPSRCPSTCDRRS